MISIALDPGLEYATAVGQDRRLIAVYYQPPLPGPFEPDEIVVEFPVWYPISPAPPNKVVELAFSAGVQAGRLGARPRDHGNLFRVPPVKLPKAEVERRVRRALDAGERLLLDEHLHKVPMGKRNNCTDAVRHLLVHWERMMP